MFTFDTQVKRVTAEDLAAMEQLNPGVVKLADLKAVTTREQAEQIALKSAKGYMSNIPGHRERVTSIALKAETKSGWTFTVLYARQSIVGTYR